MGQPDRLSHRRLATTIGLTVVLICGGAILSADLLAEATKVRSSVAPVAKATAGQGTVQSPFQPVRLFAEGDPQEIGMTVGKAYGPRIKQFHAQFLGTAMLLTGKNQKLLYASSARLAKHLDPIDVAEIQGLAKGAGMPYEDVLFLNMFYALVVDQAACRQLVVWDRASINGKLIHARNLDWRDYPGQPLQRHNVILNIKQKTGPQYLVLTWPGLQSTLTGTNSHGITVGFNQINGGGPPKRDSEPAFFTLKRILRTCKTLEEAVKLVKDTHPLGNASLMISDAKQKKAAVIELINGQMGIRYPSKKQMIGNANHATADAGIKNVPIMGPATSPAVDVAASLNGRLDVTGIQGVMANRKVCKTVNLLSVVFVPDENKMYLACGCMPAAQSKFKTYTIFEEPGEKKNAPAGKTGALQSLKK